MLDSVNLPLNACSEKPPASVVPEKVMRLKIKKAAAVSDWSKLARCSFKKTVQIFTYRILFAPMVHLIYHLLYILLTAAPELVQFGVNIVDPVGFIRM